MNKKQNHISARQAAEKAVIRDEQNRRIQFAATNPEGEVLKELHTTLCGLDMEEVSASRTRYGSSKVTHEKKKSLLRRLADAFINPFTAILFFLALVSTMTDMVFPYFSLFGSAPEDFDCLTAVIILTMVVISGTLRFVQESRSGNAAERLLAMITTTCTVTRRNQEKAEIPMDELVDKEAELKRLNKELETAQKQLDQVNAKLNNPGFTGKAPANVVEGARQNAQKLEDKIKMIASSIEALNG